MVDGDHVGLCKFNKTDEDEFDPVWQKIKFLIGSKTRKIGLFAFSLSLSLSNVFRGAYTLRLLVTRLSREPKAGRTGEEGNFFAVSGRFSLLFFGQTPNRRNLRLDCRTARIQGLARQGARHGATLD